MKKIIFFIFIIILLIWRIFAVAKTAEAACIWNGNTGTVAAPYDDTDMASCISDAMAKTGAVIILISNCEITWDTVININMANWQNVTSLTIQGASKTGTIITNSTWAITTKTNKKFRITNMTLKGSILGGRYQLIGISGDTKPSLGGGFRIDNIVFNSDDNPGVTVTGRAIGVNGDAYGVIDNIDAGWYGQFAIVYTGIANSAWSADDNFGTSDAVYLENSKLTNKRPAPTQSMIMDHWDGAKIVIRYNDISGYYFGGHDYLDNFRSNRHWEFYNNIVNTSSPWGTPLFSLRGGTGYVYNNQMFSTVAVPFYGPTSGIALTNYRSWSKRDTWCDNIAEKMCVVGSLKVCSTDSDCGGVMGACQQIDGNIDGTGYPCRDQIGLGKNQAIRPALFWNNTLKILDNSPIVVNAMANNNCIADSSGVLCNPLAIASGDTRWMATNHIKENRDFCNTDTIMPTSCNGIATDYMPYNCPHPLANLTGSCDSNMAGTTGYNVNAFDIIPPSPPMGLTIN